MTRTPLRWIDAAIERFEKGTLSEGAFAAALKLLLAGAYESVLEFRQEYDENPTSELGDPLSWAYVMQGNALSETAQSKRGDEDVAAKLLVEAAEKYQAAVTIKPGYDSWLEQLGQCSGRSRTD